MVRGERKNRQFIRRPVEKEEFSQPHYELLNEYRISNYLTFNSALFLVTGEGFFDYDASWADADYFRLTEEFGFESGANPLNSLIRAKVENKQWGWIPRLRIEHPKGSLILGGEARFHNSVHWGSIEYAEKLPAGLNDEYRYYYYEGGKDILNTYAHEQFELSNKINLLAEAQVAYHEYEIKNEKYLDNEFKIANTFFNPRFGINYKLNSLISFYGSFAVVTREPRLKNYYDAAESSGGAVPQFEQTSSGVYNFNEPLVHPESMKNVELGAKLNGKKISLSLNLFYMNFDDEIVKQGQIDRFGQPVTGNIENTIHSGVEFAGLYKPSGNFEFVLNGSYGRNYINKGFAFIEYYDEGNSSNKVTRLDLSGNAISGFPEFTFNGIFKFRYKGFLAQVSAKYVGEFYSDNYEDNLGGYISKYPGFLDYSDNKVEAYFVSNIIARYAIEEAPYFERINFFIQINNVFDNLYAAYAIGKEYFPAAERNFMIGLEIGL